jgi:hypothetical protein
MLSRPFGVLSRHTMTRRKAAPSMMQGAPSADPPEASPRPTTPPCRQKGSSKASPGPRKRWGRTSTLGPPASDPRQTRSACNGKQHYRPCRSSHGCKREGQTTHAIDTKVRESQSRGRSQALLYNELRTHLSLDKDSPGHRPIQRLGQLAARPILGGLHHQYCRI